VLKEALSAQFLVPATSASCLLSTSC